VQNHPIRVAIVANIGWNIYNFRLPLIDILLKSGYKVVLVAQEDEYADRLRALGCRFVPLLHLQRKGTNPWADLQLFWELRGIFVREQIAAAFLFTIKPNIYGAMAAKWVKIPVIATVTGLGYTFLHQNFTAKVARFLYKWAFKNLNRVVFQNEEDRNLFIGENLVQFTQTALIRGSGVNCRYFVPKPNFDFAHRPFVFLFVGRLLYDKGIREFLKAARVLRAEWGKTVEFRILGALDNENPAAISGSELQIYTHNAEVSYIGKTDDVLPYIQTAHVVVLPSYREGLPRVLLEAAAAAKPIITTDTAGCKDMIFEQKNGILIPVQDTAALITACRELYYQNTEQLLAMGLEGRNFVIQNFSDVIISQQFLDLLLTELDKNG
jgi:glycosyltransferase involved in cell wall biosynthesis